MREVSFVKQNSEKWKRFEACLENKDTYNPDEIISTYAELIDNLSYARTFYPTSVTYKYLNELSAKAHQVIYNNKKEKKNRLITFWKEELPTIIYQSRRALLISFIIFLIAVTIGIVSSANDDSFVRLILGDSYVDMTLENIKNGHPLQVYNRDSSLISFLLIAWNNIFVAFRTFAAGIFFSFGAALMVLYNGIMVGSFEYFLFHYGAGQESLLTIWLHGTIEISVLIISGCSGIVMGNSIVFPGTYSRAESFKRGAGKGLKIVIGTVPFFIVAAFIEGFITRYARTSHIFDIIVISLSLILIIGYFVVYPFIVNRKSQP